ncbi:hypothetical protein BZA05DRAFT_132128 [Tricharina praecox]|uniref:uncharacterized protein n=1 Tax=Tricharina praecox TaxID=43433 RepID=UPI00221F76EB|nr:uncharacterized protein BZA05DRAFT_132128 [Tricharina praecox]KAI5847002.1 hypothetical protein BZA05DRAFT_132128 [Tricharina praecox]
MEGGCQPLSPPTHQSIAMAPPSTPLPARRVTPPGPGRRGTTVTPTRRGAILALRYGSPGFTIRQISEQLGVSKSTVHGICKHAEKKARALREERGADTTATTTDDASTATQTAPSLLELLAASAPYKASGRPRKHALTATGEDGDDGDNPAADGRGAPTPTDTPTDTPTTTPAPDETSLFQLLADPNPAPALNT